MGLCFAQVMLVLNMYTTSPSKCNFHATALRDMAKRLRRGDMQRALENMESWSKCNRGVSSECLFAKLVLSFWVNVFGRVDCTHCLFASPRFEQNKPTNIAFSRGDRLCRTFHKVTGRNNPRIKPLKEEAKQNWKGLTRSRNVTLGSLYMLQAFKYRWAIKRFERPKPQSNNPEAFVKSQPCLFYGFISASSS